MAISCSTDKKYFDISNNNSSILKIANQIFRDYANESVENKYNIIKEKLLQDHSFLFGEESSDQHYALSILLLQTHLLSLIEKFAEKRGKLKEVPELKKIFETNFLSDAGVTYDTSTMIEEVDSPVLEGDMINENERLLKKLSDIEDEYYKTVIKAKLLRRLQFNRELTELAIINIQTGTITKDVITLNKNIALLKNKYFNNIITWLKSIDSNFSYDKTLYNEDGTVTKNYLYVLNKFYNELKKTENIESKITEGWKKRLLGNSDIFYDALNSYINLVYFDTIVEEATSKMIQITNNALRNDEWDLSYKKYGYSQTTDHKVKNWSDQEKKDALQSIAKFSKLILETIPIYSSVTGKFLNRYVNTGNFANAITSLFVNVSKFKNRYLTLLNAIVNFHNDPRYYSAIIFKEIDSNKNLLTELINKGVNLFNLNILTSVFKHVYDISNPNSIISIETSNVRNNFDIYGYSIIDTINGVIDRVMDATYLQILYSTDTNTTEVSEKHKFTNRRESYNTIHRINALNSYDSRPIKERKTLNNKYKIERNDSYKSYKVNIDGLEIIGTVSSDLGILDSKPISFKFNNDRFTKIFDSNSSLIDLVSLTSINKILSGKKLSDDEQLFRNVLAFIDDFLNTRLLSKSGLETLFYFKESLSNIGKTNYIQGMLASAVKAAVINNFNIQFNLGLESGKYKSILNYDSFIKNVYTPVSSLKLESIKKLSFIEVISDIPQFISVNTSDTWIDEWAIARKTLSGEISKSTIKNLNNNSISNNRISFLGGNLKYYLSKYKNGDTKSAVSPLLFTNNSDLIVKTVINTDAQCRKGVVKDVKKMNAAELFYTSIVNNFFGNYLQNDINPDKFKDDKNNLYKTVLIQPTTFSDKITFITYAINANKAIYAPGKSYDGKTIFQLNTNLVIDLYLDTIGEAYINLYNNVLNELRIILDMPTASFEEINNELHNISEELLKNKAVAKGMEVLLDTHYRKFGNKCKFNELLYHYANELYADRNNLVKRFEKEKINFINDLIDSGISFFTTYSDDVDNTINTNKSNNIISKIINSIYKDKLKKSDYINKWVKYNKLIIAKVTDKTGHTIDILGGLNIPENSKVELNPLLEKYFYTDSLLSNNLRFELTGSEIAHPDKAKINYTIELINNNITPSRNPEYFKLIKPISIEKIRNKNLLFNTKALQSSEIEYDIVSEPWKEDPTKTKTVLKIWIKGQKLLGTFDLIADTDFNVTLYNGEYSVHFKTGDAETGEIYGSTKELRAILYKYLMAAIPTGAKVSTWGNISKGGIMALEKVTKGMKIVGTRIIKDRQNNPLTINVYQKTEAIDNFKDLIWLRNEAKTNSILLPVYDKAITKIEAMAQGTLLKRNVIIPATLLYYLQNTITGIPSKMKVAVIKDTQAKIFNFRGDSTTEDAHDGSAFISPLISILENKALQDLEVGVDKKPIWHHFNSKLMTATLLKFATFTMTAERMRTSLRSDINLYNLFKLMHDLNWAELDDNGQAIKWNNSEGDAIDLIHSVSVKKYNHKLDFLSDIIGDNQLFYEENGTYYQINGFGRDENGYYTEELEVNFQGNSKGKPQLKVYHRFDNNSTHFKYIEGRDTIPPMSKNLHDINSLFQLYNVLGGIYALSLTENDKGFKSLKYSDSAAYATVNFMNAISIRKKDNADLLSLKIYYLPLKEMLIGYAANNSAVKNGASNINDEKAWKGNTKLTYMTLDTDGLGILMDADHDIEESLLTEFTLVISALEAGGRLHNEAKEVYKTLGLLAIHASKFEIEAATAYIKAAISENKEFNGMSINQIRSELYDIFGRTFINNYKQKEDRMDITGPIIDKIKKRFNLNEDHNLDEFKLASSDNSLYSQIIPTFISNINQKSIKRKYPGSGCVMVPGYNIILNYKYNGLIKQFDDVLKEARQYNQKSGFKLYTNYNSSLGSITDYNSNLVKAYLTYLLKIEWTKANINIEQFMPTDIVDVLVNGSYIGTISLDGIEDYYSFLGYSLLYPNATEAERDIIRRGFILKKLGINVNSAKLTFATNITKPRNLAPAKIRWKYRDKNGIEHIENIFNTKPVRESFMRKKDVSFDLKENRKLVLQIFDLLDRGKYLNYEIYDLENEAAELVISNMYASKFDTKGLSISEILDRGSKHFAVGATPVKSLYYDLVFTTNSGEHLYISFTKPKADNELTFRPKYIKWKNTKCVGNDVYAITKDGRKLFKVGTWVVKENARKVGDKYVDGNEKPLEEGEYRTSNTGLVLEYKEFISNYKISEIVQKKKSGGHVNWYDLYTINVDNLIAAYGLDIDTLIAEILSDIYGVEDFNCIRLNNLLLKQSAIRLANILPQINVSKDLQLFLKTTTEKYLTNIDENKEMHVIATNYNDDLKEYYNLYKDTMFTSFLKSLTFTASRIPALTLQSFMLMKAVGFTLSSKNIVYVSHWQTWLQGSDYKTI